MIGFNHSDHPNTREFNVAPAASKLPIPRARFKPTSIIINLLDRSANCGSVSSTPIQLKAKPNAANAILCSLFKFEYAAPIEQMIPTT